MGKLVSVVMPVWNGMRAGPDFLKLAVFSLVHQDYDGPIEIILIDDGSADTTLEVAKSWSKLIEREWKSRRLVVIPERRIGITKALNVGLRNSSGEYIARSDADDFSQPERIREQVDYLDSHPDVGLVASAVQVVQGSKRSEDVWYRWGAGYITPEAFRKESPLCHGSVMFRRTVLDAVGLYDERYKHAQDYDFFWRIVRKFHIASIPKPLYSYRVHRNRITAHSRHFQIQLDNKREIKQRIGRELNQT